MLSTIVLIVVASAASHEFRPKEALISGMLLAALAVGVFVIGLKLQLPIWPAIALRAAAWNCSTTSRSASASR